MKQAMFWPLLIFSIGVFMAGLDNGIISAALTTLIDAFDVTPTWGSWTITIYTLGMAVSIPVIGKMADRYGIKRLLLIEVCLFGLGSLLVALSFTFEMFLVSRFIQAIGGGGIFVLASAYIIKMFPKEKQGQSLGMVGGMNGIAAVIGPNVGSLILSVTGSWHWLFLINLPIAILLLVAGLKYIQSPEQNEAQSLKPDWAGISLLSLALLGLMYSFTTLEGADLLESLTASRFLIFFGIGVALLVILIIAERSVQKKKTTDPILPVNLLKDVSYRWTLGLAFFSGAILASVIFIPAYIEQYLGVPRHLSGYWFTPLALASGIGAGAGGALVDRRGPIPTLIFAALFAIAGFVLFPLWVSSLWQMVIASCLVGIGFGTMLGAPINVLATENAGSNEATALATSSLLRQIGMTLAPTIYAGFIARSFMNLEETIKQNMEGSSIPLPPDVSHPTGENMEFAAVREAFESIPDPKISEVLLTSFEDVMKTGYDGLFAAACTVSVLMLLATLILGFVRSRKKKATIAEGREADGTQTAD